MTRIAFLGALLIAWLGTATETRAQTGRLGPANPRSRPVVSPYTNLLRSDSVGLNYFGLVRPQQAFREESRRLQFDLENFQREAYRIDKQEFKPDANLFRTGHRTEFGSDLQSIPRSMNLEISSRRAAAFDVRDRSFSHLPQSGHRAFFGNQGNYYREQTPR